MRLTEKGQVTVPKRMRDRFGLRGGVDVEFEATEAGLLLRPAGKEQGRRLAAGIHSVRGSADAGLSTDAVMALTRD